MKTESPGVKLSADTRKKLKTSRFEDTMGLWLGGYREDKSDPQAGISLNLTP